MENVTIIWSDGSELEADKNGSCFIVDEKPEFPSDLEEVTIEENGAATTLHNARIVECASVDGKYWFSIQEIPEDTIEKATMKAQIDYIAMMADIDLEEVL
jgi:hypothetical protein